MRFRIILFCLLFFSALQGAYAQFYNLNSGWYLGANAGVASVFGDLSIYDLDPVKKLKHESRPDFGIALGKSLNRWIDFELNADRGGLESARISNDLYFKNHFTEISLFSHFDLIRLFLSNKDTRFRLFLSGGAGVIVFRATQYRISDNSVVSAIGRDSSGEKTGNPELVAVLPGGLTFSYHINQNWTVRSRFAFRITGSDQLDAHVGSTGINDRYAVSTIGVAYFLSPANSKKSDPLPCPDFTRLIHSQ